MPDGQRREVWSRDRAWTPGNVSAGTGDAAADAAGVANSGVINGSVTVTTSPRPRTAATVLTIGLAVLGLNAIGAVRWPQSLLAWLTIIVGATAVLFGVPLAWSWSARRGTGWQAETLFAAAMTMSLVGAAFVGGGGIVVARPSGTVTQPEGVRPGDPTGEPAVSAGEPPIKEPPVRRKGTVTLKAGSQIDLDSTDPAWGVVVGEDSADARPESDLTVQLGSIHAVNKAQLARSESVAYAACRGATNFGGGIPSDEEGTAMACLRTGRNRVAAIQVLTVSRSDIGFFEEVTLAVTVW